jgi:hypothetical protein
MKIAVIILVVALVVATLVIAVIKRREAAITDEPWPFDSKKPLTEPEQILYHRLMKALPECIVLAQVQVSRVIGVKKGYSLYKWNNRINRLSLDFVVCLKDSTVVAAIELDDSSHNDSSRQDVDVRKGKALQSAGVPLIRWSVSELPDEAAIRAAITK